MTEDDDEWYNTENNFNTISFIVSVIILSTLITVALL